MKSFLEHITDEYTTYIEAGGVYKLELLTLCNIARDREKFKKKA